MEMNFQEFMQEIFERTINANLTDRLVYEFCEQCYHVAIHGPEKVSDDYFEKLWGYLSSCRQNAGNLNMDSDALFRLGRMYAAMEFLRINQKEHDAEHELECDAKEFYKNWYPVFQILGREENITHKQLAERSDKSDSSLSQFMNRIERKNYIHFRKAGRTKYYRLSHRGKLLLEKMREYDKTLSYRKRYFIKPFSNFMVQMEEKQDYLKGNLYFSVTPVKEANKQMTVRDENDFFDVVHYPKSADALKKYALL